MSLVVRVRPGGNDEALARAALGSERSVQVVIAIDWLAVINRQFGAVRRSRRNWALVMPRELPGFVRFSNLFFPLRTARVEARGFFAEQAPRIGELRIELSHPRALLVGRQQKLRSPRIRAAVGD